MDKPLGVAIVGCGRIGTRRADVAAASGDRVLLAVDTNEGSSHALARRHRCAVGSLDEALRRTDVDAIVVATVNSSLASITRAAVLARKHVLCEKPFANSVEEASMVADAVTPQQVVKIGFNHRYHPAIALAHRLMSEGAIGDPISVRGAYGHGGREGYANEWRADRTLSGGGELIDQGVHLVDLSRWFLGELNVVAGVIGTWFWPVQVEDNAFALLATPDGRVASLHASWTQWRNLFRFEVIGRNGLLTVEGLGGSYGVERLTLGSRERLGAPPSEREWTFDGPDDSWESEWSDFTSAIRTQQRPLSDVADAIGTVRIVEELYSLAQARSEAFVPRPMS